MNRAVVFRQIALGDLLLFCGLAVPGLGAWILDVLLAANEAVDWPGSLAADASAVLFLHLLGLLGAGFAYLRLQMGPTASALNASIVVKVVAVGLFVSGVLAGAPAVFLVLAGIDLVQAGLLLLLRTRHEPV